MSFYFAWVTAAETTFGPEHHVTDEDVFSFEIIHAEGEFPQARIEIQNPRVGLLAAGRKQWAWLSYDDGSSVTALFFGRLVAVPQELQGEVIALEFVARPTDWDDQREVVAATLRVAPFWDPVWIAEERRDDPDAALDARSALWHVDRTTHTVSVSDIAEGEDGTVDFAADFLRDSLSITHEQVPARRVKVRGEVHWTQAAKGSVNLFHHLIAAARAAGSERDYNIETYTGEGLARDWPEKGDRIGGGWSVGDSYVERGDGRWVPQDYETILTVDNHFVDFPLWTFRPHMEAVYDVARSRSEIIRFTLRADTQAVATDAGEEELIEINLSSRAVGEPIDPPLNTDGDGDIPIGNVRRRAYFPTNRGHQSVKYLIALARARLLFKARAVTIVFDVPFADGLALSCRKSASITDARIPGGSASGKIALYRLYCDGATGDLGATVTIGCMVGQGGSVTEVAGTPDYVADGYVETAYQIHSGATYEAVAGEVTYDAFDKEPNDDGIVFPSLRAAHVVETCEMVNGRDDQSSLLRAYAGDPWHEPRDAVAALQETYTQYRLVLTPLAGGPFRTRYNLGVSNLEIPQTIDLEAV